MSKTGIVDVNVHVGRVVNNEDPFGGNRIQVRMGNIYDGDVNSSDLVWCSPLMPKLINIIPQVGELVFIFFRVKEASEGTRLYLGPILSQPQNFGYDFSFSSQAYLDNAESSKYTLPHPNMDENNLGTLPNLNDIALIGRDNTSVMLKPHEVRIMCGYNGGAGSDTKTNLRFNKENPAFIQMQFHDRSDKSKMKIQKIGNDDVMSTGEKGYKSSINVFADRINLLSRHTDVTTLPAEFDQDKLITDDTMETLLKDCHPLVYGDKLVELLKLMVQTISQHEHPYAQIPTTPDANIVKLNAFDFDTILSKAVKTC